MPGIPKKVEVDIPRAFSWLQRPSRYKAAHGGRGSAKSHSFASALVQRGVQRPTRILCAREIQKSLSTSVHQLLVDKIEQHKLQGAYSITREGIVGPNDTKFMFAGLRSNPESIKSMEGLDIAWVEEANRCSQQSLDLLSPTLRKDDSELWFTWNRNQATDPVDHLFLGGPPPPDTLLKQVNWRDNPFFPNVLKREMEWMKSRDWDKYMHIWEGELLNRSDAKVFKQWRVDDLDEEVASRGLSPKFGADWGFSIDPSVLIKVYVIEELNILYIAREAWELGCPIDDLPALFAGDDNREEPRWENKKKRKGIDGVMEGLITADNARPETIRYLKDRGFTIRGAIKGARSIEEGVEFVQSFDIVVHPNCYHTQDELDTYSYKIDKITEEVLPELEDKDNHVIDSLRYALESYRKAVPTRGPSLFYGRLVEG